jgi:type 1 fimbria pilin
MSNALKFKTTMLPCMLILSFWEIMNAAAHAHQINPKHGIVSMQGSIIDTPCAIDIHDIDQTINMSGITVDEIINNGHSQPQPFSLTLVNCTLDGEPETNPHFKVTFDGPSDSGAFSVSGATGVSLEISDAAGNIAIPGKTMPEGIVVAGTQRLDYSLRLVRNHDAIKAGSYRSALRFSIDYF